MANTPKKPKVIVICGPTGSGKTELAVFLCLKFGGEIVSADSRQVYRYMNIGTGKELDRESQISNLKSQNCRVASPHTILISGSRCRPSGSAGCPTSAEATIGGIPIHLVNIKNPDERFTVGNLKVLAEEKIEEIIAGGKVPFLVGGTGLYIDAVVDNFQFSIFNFQSNPNFQFSKETLGELVKKLLKLDPTAVHEVDLKNRRRVHRALEVCLATGKPFTEQKTKGERKYEVLKLAPKIEREELNKKTNKRVKQMVANGLEEEVAFLADKYGWESEAMTGIGYKEWEPFFVISNLKSQVSKLAEARHKIIEQIKINTRRYAKRQMTWFKRDKEIHWVVDEKEAEGLVKDFLGGR